ncbi:MAG: helix-turn-helix domain-containing protein [Dehalococcoidia bacterium]
MATATRTEEAPVRDLLRRVRRDALPEEISYRDDGCDIHPHCLTCPLPRCRYDEPGGLRAMLNAYRDERIVALRRDGAPVDHIAERYSLSRRTVFRILSSAGANGAGEHTGKEALYA